MEQVPTLRGDGVVVRAWNDRDLDVVMAVADDPLIPLISSVSTDATHDAALAFVARLRPER